MTAARPTHLILTLSKQRPKKGSIFFLLPDNLLPKIPEETTCSNNDQPVSLFARPSAVQNSSYRWTWSWADSLHVFESEEADEGKIKRADGFLAQPHWKIIFIQPTVLPSLCLFFFFFNWSKLRPREDWIHLEESTGSALLCHFSPSSPQPCVSYDNYRSLGTERVNQ